MAGGQTPPAVQQQQRQDEDVEMRDAPVPVAAPTTSASSQSSAEAPSSDNTANSSPSPQQLTTSNNPTTQCQQAAPADRPQQSAPPPVPGPRAARLQALFAQTVKHTLDKINKDNFASCFPTMAVKAPGTLEFVRRQMVERLGGLWEKEFDSILQNRSVVLRLNELEALVADAGRRRQAHDPNTEPPVPPHTLPAPVVLSSHLRPHFKDQHSRLEKALDETQSTNEKLWAEISAQRVELESLLASLEQAARDVQGAGELLAEVVDKLGEETREGDRVVRQCAAGVLEGR
ncbi:uncharacterized protein CTHT_0025950 [Thermochaetoides thermophila DSM 1495]|uniref:Uncharacterized protein n=1 Tax=Chaetomium thermophilum (strain DSM 1495 / CBS 144.50 / IMI 039719) TaxID=759272 RepID=G0S695_CHATD|nr:hypothetical protein CTHT_0025950 [Thermochaetoides thermophila DSM 1495]EGS20759.1 hypothetical protein CTHT_0025950 [Thermochaetoides thermophila DSM 1495]